MVRVTLVAFRKNAKRILRRVGQGERLLLTRRGRPVARLEPVAESEPGPDDPLYHLGERAVAGGRPLSNREIDRILYGA